MAVSFLQSPVLADEPHPTAFVWYGEPDPSGVDQAFLAIGRRRGAPAVREVPGLLAEEPLSLRLSRGVAAAQALDFQHALAEFDAVEREAVARGGGALTEGELVDLYAYRAGVHSAVGDEADSWNDLVAAAALAPSRPLDPARFPPRLIEAARRAEQSVRERATLTVVAQPADAIVVVDGQLVGRGRVEVSRPPGRHFVRVERAGFAGKGTVADLGSSGATVRLTLDALRPPDAVALARRGQLADAKRTLGAYLTAAQGKAVLTLVVVDNGNGHAGDKATIPVDEQLTSGELAARVDELLGGESARANPLNHPPRPWYGRTATWLVVGGVGAAALAVGLGVGLSERQSGAVTHIDLGPAR